MTGTPASDPWAGLLDPGEEILWQGRPDGRPQVDFSRPAPMLMGAFFMVFSVVWMNMASRAGGYFWMFGLIFFGIGFYNVIGVHLWTGYRRAHTHYTLTTKRAFIATDILGRRSLRSYPIDPEAEIELIDGPLATVHFARVHRKGRNGGYHVPVGFERIAEGRAVYRHLRQIQQGAA